VTVAKPSRDERESAECRFRPKLKKGHSRRRWATCAKEGRGRRGCSILAKKGSGGAKVGRLEGVMKLKVVPTTTEYKRERLTRGE